MLFKITLIMVTLPPIDKNVPFQQDYRIYKLLRTDCRVQKRRFLFYYTTKKIMYQITVIFQLCTSVSLILGYTL